MTDILNPSANAAPLLSYALALQPDPLQASNRAALNLVVSNATDDEITCFSIQLTLPVGTDATDLIDGSAAIATQPASGWSANVQGGVVTFTAPAGGAVIEIGGLVFMIATTANAQPGTASITLQETASDDGGPQQQGTGTFSVNKFPADFSLSELTAVPPGNLDIPYGQPAQLTWTAIGQGVSCTLQYQPAEAGTPVSVSVPNMPDGGSYQTQPLTRSEGVIFTLFATVNVLGQDNPLSAQRQLGVSVESMSITVGAQPPTVGPYGLTVLQWNAPNATHCTLDDGTILTPSGSRYVVVATTHVFTVTAVGASGLTIPGQVTVQVDPSIQATEGGHVVSGNPGGTGSPGFVRVIRPTDGRPWVFATPGGTGGQGDTINLTVALPPLLPTSDPSRVIPISLTGGSGGPGGPGNGAPSGAGGPGGNVMLTATFDPSQQPPAQYLITLTGGTGGLGGDNGAGAQGSKGSVSATIGGQTVYFY